MNRPRSDPPLERSRERPLRRGRIATPRSSPALLTLTLGLAGLGCGGDDGGVAPAESAIIAAISGDGQTDTIGATMANPLAVRAVDEAGRGVPGIGIHFEVIDGEVSLSSSDVETDREGRASVTAKLGESTGSILVEARNDALRGSPVSFRLTSMHGNPARIVGVTGDDQLRFPGISLAEPLVIELADRAGNRVEETGLAVTWEVLEGGGSIEPEAESTDSVGRVAAAWTLGPDEGVNVARAGSGDLVAATFQARAAHAGPIVFNSGRDGGGLFVANPDGRDVIRLTLSSVGAGGWPDWSPDGSRIAFARGMGQGRLDIFVVDSDGSDQTRLTFTEAPGVMNLHPAWAPDGSKIAFSSTREGCSQIFLMNTDGGDVARLSDGSHCHQNPSWSADGSQMVVTSWSQEDFPPDLWVIDVDGSERRRLTDLDEAAARADWSPDGSRIVFKHESAIWVIDSDGSGLERVAVTGGGAGKPRWAPDSRRIIYPDAGNNGALDLFVLDLETGETTNITDHPANEFEVAWRR